MRPLLIRRDLQRRFRRHHALRINLKIHLEESILRHRDQNAVLVKHSRRGDRFKPLLNQPVFQLYFDARRVDYSNICENWLRAEQLSVEKR